MRHGKDGMKRKEPASSVRDHGRGTRLARMERRDPQLRGNHSGASVSWGRLLGKDREDAVCSHERTTIYCERMKEYVAVLGRQPELSAAELYAVSQSLRVSLSPLSPQVMLVNAPSSFAEQFPRFGGLVKLGAVLTRLSASEHVFGDGFLKQLFPHLPTKGKIVFGVSTYGSPAFLRATQQLGKRLKVFFSENGRPSRFLASEQGVLSSVVVAKERLVERGMELLLIESGQGDIVVACTVAVQAFEDFSTRDYGRPKRDAVSGMLPPKLARIMVNLSGAGASARLLDPFCGSGTVVQEALLLGCRSVVGSDISQKAINETKENLTWLSQTRKLDLSRMTLLCADVAQLGQSAPPASIDAIVTEPFLGPPQESDRPLALRTELETLYLKAFHTFFQLLTTKGRVVFLFPVFYYNEKPHFVLNLDALLHLGYRLLPALSSDLIDVFRDRLSYRNSIVYHRPGQRVGRELLLFEKIARVS